MSSESDRGSPPRMRGKDAGCLVHHEKHRITPAYAGKRCLGHLFQVELRDHPRVCGEKMQRFWKRVRRWGLPPRMRGKGQTFLADDLRVGITPAYAGKRQGFRGAYYSTGDHPRVCGEKHAVPVSAIWSAGSPPRVRGKVTIPGAYSTTDGITPAYAGKRTVYTS